nr:D361 [uncultured bacterium]
MQSPRAAIDKNLSRSILLYAVEVFDDALVGLTLPRFDVQQSMRP